MKFTSSPQSHPLVHDDPWMGAWMVGKDVVETSIGQLIEFLMTTVVAMVNSLPDADRAVVVRASPIHRLPIVNSSMGLSVQPARLLRSLTASWQ